MAAAAGLVPESVSVVAVREKTVTSPSTLNLNLPLNPEPKPSLNTIKPKFVSVVKVRDKF